VFGQTQSTPRLVHYPYKCAGSFKSETPVGASLFEIIEGDDADAMVGLPLIQLANMLQKEGVSTLKN
jgi:predicted house-cleaning NTP pyrophosphatase (Maf/HAM1 superfamily)